MASGAELKGAEAMRRKLRAFAQRFPDEVGRALYQETEVEATEVKRLTPVRFGALKGSIHVVGPVRTGSHIYTFIVAGGPAASYAVIVHEDPYAIHRVGQWKYLETVVLASRPFMAARVAARIDLNRVLLSG